MVSALALVAAALWGGSNYLGGRTSRSMSALATVFLAQSLSGAVLAIVLAVLRPQLSLVGFAWGAMNGGIGVVASVCFYAALACGTMGVVAPIAAAGTAIPVAVGIVRGDAPSIIGAFGLAVAFGGVLIASMSRSTEHRPANGPRSIRLAIIAAVLTGTASVCMTMGAADGGVASTLLGMRTAASVTVITGIVLLRRPVGRFLAVGRPRVQTTALLGCVDLTACGVYAYASAAGSLPVAAVLGSLNPIGTLILAKLFDDERLARWQKTGVGLTMAGVVLIGAGG